MLSNGGNSPPPPPRTPLATLRALGSRIELNSPLQPGDFFLAGFSLPPPPRPPPPLFFPKSILSNCCG